MLTVSSSGFSAEKIEKYRNLDYSISITKDGDSYKIEVDFKGAAPNASYSLRVGEEIDYKSIDGYTAKVGTSSMGTDEEYWCILHSSVHVV